MYTWSAGAGLLPGWEEVGEHYRRANREQSSCPILTEQLQQHRELGWDLTHSRVFSGELRL